MKITREQRKKLENQLHENSFNVIPFYGSVKAEWFFSAREDIKISCTYFRYFPFEYTNWYFVSKNSTIDMSGFQCWLLKRKMWKLIKDDLRRGYGYIERDEHREIKDAIDSSAKYHQ